MIDALWIATSGTAYARENCTLERADEFLFEFFIDRHPCDDEPYVAHLVIVGAGWRHTEQFDGQAGDSGVNSSQNEGTT